MSQIEFVSGFRHLRPSRGSVVTIGAFDGVHLGHQQLLRQLIADASALKLQSVVIVFEPQPNEYFQPNSAPARLMRLREKVEAFSHYGVERVLCLKFDRQLSSLSAESFIDEILVKGLAVKKLVVGDDFKFGSDRKGDFRLLKESGKTSGFDVSDTESLLSGNTRISSTYVRELLREARLAEAETLIGRPYCNIGRVIYGRQLGRELGFPTMNVHLGRLHVPLRGVYAVEVELHKKRFQGVANVGVRPTVNEVLKPLLEVHLFDADVDAYGAFIKVFYRKKIRDERRFESIDALKKQIYHDTKSAREYFGLE